MDKRYQKFFIIYEITKNKEIDNPTLYNKFNKITHLNLDLTISQISKIRKKYLDEYKN